MASNAATRSAYLGPSLSLDHGAPLFAVGEFVLIPKEIRVEGYVENEATAVGTDLPPVSTGSGPQHFSFIREVRLRSDRSFALEVYPVLSFTSTGGALPTYNRMSDAAKAALLPLPPLSSRHPTPDAFGEPLDFGNWSTDKDSFLHVFPRRLTMPTKESFKRMDHPLIMPFSVLFRIDSYREYLLSTTAMINPIPLLMAGAEIKKEALTLHMDTLETGEGRRLPE
ncbi:hypothetical protein M378DRAFT_533771 [Amanita muscaria Koide BX008]|uniref:Uncharacterized protein n=1 Tax=Amanita muscaria (strain Koide BX008) TaxID=946122 RepID=A0A0C2TEF4_AMAMK|nr:hypothetical protein M378DRAFT_533771 [Amanita muscaria Koide BX008]